MVKVLYIDPPSGWKYGFPKVYPTDVDPKDTIKWLISQGYPQEEIDCCGDYFYCRYFSQEEEEEEDDG